MALAAGLGLSAALAPNPAPAAGAPPPLQVTLTDPAGDDTGPGTYVHPGVEGFRRGTFDLREVRLQATEGGVDIRVTTGSPAETVRVRTSVAQQTREVFLPVIDLYVSDAARVGEGRTALLPGRRVSAADPRGWDRAVVISALPEVLEAHYRRAAPGLAAATCFPRGVSRSGRTMTVHVPRACLPMDLSRAGFLVVVTGLGAGGGFQGMLGREGAREDQPDPWVRGVDPVVGNCNVWEDGLGVSPCAFGGCEPCGAHPHVLDAIVPEGARQADLLKGYSTPARRVAALPFVWPAGAPPARVSPAGGQAGSAGAMTPTGLPGHPIEGIRGEQVTVRLPPEDPSAPPAAGTLGAIVCPDGRPGGTVVVRGTAGGFLVLDRVPDGKPVCPGGSVLF